MLPGVTPGYLAPVPVAGNPLAMNLGQLAYFDSQQMFLNVLKQASTEVVYAAWNTTVGTANASTAEESYLQLDSDGYVTSLSSSPTPAGGQVFTAVQAAVFVNMPTAPGVTSLYPSGSYRFRFTGKGTLTFGGDVDANSLSSGSSGVTISNRTITSTNTGQVVVTLNITTPSTAGIRLWITALPDSANYPRAMDLVGSSWTTIFDGGQIFHPNFLTAVQTGRWKVLRFMDTLNTNGQLRGGPFGYQEDLSLTAAPTAGTSSVTFLNQTTNPYRPGAYTVTFDSGETTTATITAGSKTVTLNPALAKSASAFLWLQLQTNFSDAPVESNFSYASWRGIPYTIAMALCNTVNAGFWCNVPAGTGSTYWASLAALIRDTLNTGVKAYIEYSNEPWNGGFATQRWSNAVSTPFFSGTQDGGGYVGAQTALMADKFATAFGNPGYDNRVIVSMPGQGINTSYMVAALTSPNWSGQTAPYLRTSASGQKTIKAGHIAPYYGAGNINAADFTFLQGRGDGGLTDFFGMLTANPFDGHTFTDPNTGSAYPSGGAFAAAASWVSNHVAAVASLGAVAIICYEGGWSFTGTGAQCTFLNTVNVDPRMAAATTTFFRTLAQAGTSLPCQYKLMFATALGNFQWGVCQSSMQNFTAFANYDAKLQGAVTYVG